LTDAKEVTNMLNSAKNPIAYTIDANEDMYVLENRQKVGFDASVPGTGLLIYHVHKDFISGNSRNINATYPQQVYPVCASGTVSIPNSSPNSYGAINSSGCPFPGTSGKTSFTDQTTPAAFYWSGSISGGGIDKPITNIKETGGVISFSFMQSTENNSIADLKNSSITAYPNPAHNQITINGLQGNGRLTVFDMVGRIRMQHNIVSSQETLSVSSLSSGNYLVQIVEGENVKYIKIIVKHTIDN